MLRQPPTAGDHDMKALYSLYADLIDRRSLWVLAVFIALLPMVGAGTRRAIQSNTNNVKDWLPDAYPETEKLRWYVSKFGAGSDHVVIVSWENCRLGDPEVALLAEKLEKANFQPPLLEGVLTGEELLAQLTGPPSNISRAEALDRLEGTLIGPDYLHGLIITADTDSRPIIRRVEHLSPAALAGLKPGDVIAEINGVPTPTAEEAVSLLEATYAMTGDGPGEGVSKETLSINVDRIQSPVSWQFSGPRPARQTALMVTMTQFGADEDHLESTLNHVRRIAREGCDIDEADLRMGGPPVDNEAIDVEGRRTLMRMAGLSFGAGLLMCWLCFRDVRLTLIVFLTALFAEGTSLAIVHYVGGRTDAIVLTMPTLIYVLAISGGVHIVNYYRDAVAEGGLAGAAHRAVRKGFVPCTLAAATTSVGLASLYIADLVPIRNFGMYSAIAVMVSLLWLFLYLPAALQIFMHDWVREKNLTAQTAETIHEPGEAMVRIAAWFTSAADWVLRRNGAVVVGAVIMTGFFGYGAGARMQTTVRLMELFNDDARIIHDYRWLESKLGSLVPMEVIIHTSAGDLVTIAGNPTGGSYALEFKGEDGQLITTAPIPHDASGNQVQRALREAGLQDAVVRTTGEAPNLTHQITSATGRDSIPIWFAGDQRELKLDGGEARIDHRLPLFYGMQLVDDARRAIESLQHVDATLSTVTFAPELRGLGLGERSTTQVLLERHKDDFIEGGYLAVDKTAGEMLYRISLRMGAFDEIDYSQFVGEIKGAVDPVVAGKPGVQVTYTGVVPLVYKAQNELLKGLFESYALAFGLIALVMVTLAFQFAGPLKCLPAGLLLMLPNFFPTAVVFGSMAWGGRLVDIGTMMTASVALGVAVDDTIHFLTWFRRGIAKGLNRREATMMAYRRCGLAMTQTTLIASAGMLVFAFSTFAPTQRFGMLMVPLMFAALVGDLIILPAMLVSGVGRFFQRGGGEVATPPSRPPRETPTPTAVSAHAVGARIRMDQPPAKG